MTDESSRADLLPISESKRVLLRSVGGGVAGRNTRSQVQGGVVLEPGEDLVRNGELCYAGAFLHVLRVPPWTGLVKGQFRIALGSSSIGGWRKCKIS